VLVQQRAGVARLQALDHLRDPVWAKKRRALGALDRPHLLGHARALVQERQQLGVERVDLQPQVGQRWGLHDRVFSNRAWQACLAGIRRGGRWIGWP